VERGFETARLAGSVEAFGQFWRRPAGRLVGEGLFRRWE
jgi:hypothetical protein